MAAVAAAALRLPGAFLLPPQSDEAGFTLVARTWAPSAEHMYGQHFLDRPPLLVAVFGVADRLGPTPQTVRLLGAVGVAAAVLLVARTALLVTAGAGTRAAAVTVAALLSSPLLDQVGSKGEVLAVPFLAGATTCALLALRDARRPPLLMAAAGLCGGVALCLKQNLSGGLVFAAALLVATAFAHRRTTTGPTGRLAAALVAGALVPLLATLSWAVGAGVRPATLWYALYGFRADASRVLSVTEGAAYERLWLLVGSAVAAGIVSVLVAFVLRLRQPWRTDRPVTLAVIAMLLSDVVALAAGGNYWRDYLFPLVPGIGLVVALLIGPHAAGLRTALAATAATATVLSTLLVPVLIPHPPEEVGHLTGTAVGAAAVPGDTLVVFGGRAEVQLASGLPSPYQHLWSLPMRTLDPDLADLRALVAGPRAPTWIVEWVSFETWQRTAGRQLRELVEERYDVHGHGCSGRTVFLLRGLERPEPAPAC